MLDNDPKALAGARNSAKDLETIQSVHDHAVKLGATCAELKVAEGAMTNVQKAVAKVKAGEHTIEECVKEYGLSADEEKQVRALVAEKPAEDKDKKFDFGKLKGAEMTKELRAATIKALTECPCSGFTADDVKLLESVSDERLEAFAASTEARKEEQSKLTAAEAKVTETEAKVTETEAKLKAAATQAPPEPKPLTEEEFMKAAPASIKSLIARQKKQDTERKDRLVTELKAAQSEFTEDELNGMDLEQLARIARVAKINELPDNYEGRGVPRAAAERKDDPFLNPPDPYAAAIEQRRKGQSVN